MLQQRYKVVSTIFYCSLLLSKLASNKWIRYTAVVFVEIHGRFGFAHFNKRFLVVLVHRLYKQMYYCSNVLTASLSDSTIIHFSDVTLLFEQWIIFKNLQFILLFLNIWTLTFYCVRLKNVFYILWDFLVSNHCWAFQSLLWLSTLPSNHSATVTTLQLVYMTLDSKRCLKKYQQFV